MEQPSVLRVHHEIARIHSREMAFDPAGDFAAQRDAARDKLLALMAPPPKATRPEPRVEYVREDAPDYDEIRFSFESEPGFYVPCHMLLPKGVYRAGGAPRPAVICLQGHSTGMHISLGRPKFPGDEQTISGGDRDFALQAVRRGYVAVAMEQRGFGELDGTLSEYAGRCHQPAMQALLLGRTLIGERASDVSRLIDALGCFPEADCAKIGLMGNSGGGTATYYTACVEPRVAVAMPSCAFCSLHDSIFALNHCQCNYIPGLYKYFEMGDLALLLAPRPLIVVCGREDKIFPLEGVEREFETVKAVYRAAGAPERCKLVVGGEGHRFYAAQAWPLYAEALASL